MLDTYQPSTPNSATFLPSSARYTESDIEDNPKSSYGKANNYKVNASRFKPQESPSLESQTETAIDNERSNVKQTNRLSTFESQQRKMMHKMPMLSEGFSTQESFKRNKNKLLINTVKEKSGKGHETLAVKKKGSLDLPKLEKKGKKKGDGTKKKNRQSNSAKISEKNQLNMLLNLQTDPVFNMVYSPSFFATNFPSSTLGDDVNYRFDAYNFKAPSLLVSEKM